MQRAFSGGRAETRVNMPRCMERWRRALIAAGATCTPCRLLGRAAAAAAALDAATEKPPAAGGGLGLPWLTRLELAEAAGALYEAAALACTASVCGVEPPVAAPLAAIYSALLGGLEAQEGSLVAVSIAAALLPHASWRVESLPSALDLLRGDRGLGAALLYALFSMRSRGYTARMLYTLPDIGDPSSPHLVLEEGVGILDVLRVAGETSIVYRDIAEGFVRSLELSTLPPDEAIVEAVAVYGRESGLLRRRGCAWSGSGLDSWWDALASRCSPGDAVDLGVLAAFLSTARKLHSTLLDGECYTVEGLCEQLSGLLEHLPDPIDPLLSLRLSKRV